MSAKKPEPFSRRDFLRLLGAGGAALALPIVGPGCDPADAGKAPDLIDWPLITPNADFYLTHTAVPDVEIDRDAWTLTVEGLVDNPQTLTYADLLALPATEEVTTLLCIGNGIGGGAIGTARWRGVTFSTLLAAWGVQSTAIDVVARDGGNYSDSIPVSHLQQNFALLAYEMNGVPLPHLHGGPVRIIVPGIYGIKNVKWLSRLEFVDYDYQGFWQTVGWSDEAYVRTLAQIRNVDAGAKLSRGLLPLSGVAYAGLRGISSVEVSVDGGNLWTPAELQAPLSPYCWARWDAAFEFPDAGDYQLAVRATDGDGIPMAERAPDNLNGSEGWHRLSITIV